MKSAIGTLSRQIIFLIPVAVVLPIYIGINGILWSGPVADGLAFILALCLILFEMKQLKKLGDAPISSAEPQIPEQ